MALKKLVIFPFNGNGMEALDCLDPEQYDFIGFIDDHPPQTQEQYPIFPRKLLAEHPEFHILAVPGSATSFRKRKEIIGSLAISPNRFITAIHPKASIGKNVKIGYNCLIMAGVVLTSNAVVKNHVCILPNTVIHHDTEINDYSIIGSNVVIAGRTIIGGNCYIGSGSNIINDIHIGDCSLVGLGGNIIKTVSHNSKMVGNPARDLNSRFI
jgi:sugar O-acyltransferase (sialic acid O-acetyltransferase NeuD family)